jgi:hypothetical protein
MTDIELELAIELLSKAARKAQGRPPAEPTGGQVWAFVEQHEDAAIWLLNNRADEKDFGRGLAKIMGRCFRAGWKAAQ